jgi:hypothetical protein
MSNEPIQINRLRVEQIDSLENLWLTLHRHHQAVVADLAPYVDDAQSWRQRREFYAFGARIDARDGIEVRRSSGSHDGRCEQQRGPAEPQADELGARILRAAIARARY